MKRCLILLAAILVLSVIAAAQSLPQKSAASLGFDGEHLALVDEIIQQAIDDSSTPGAVLLVMRQNKIALRKAYGYQQLIPAKIPMAATTIFDLASLTKPIATATSAMILIDRGQLRLLDPIDQFIPGFLSWQNDSTKHNEKIRIIHLLTHTSGLPSYAPVKELETKYGSPAPDSMISYIARVKRHHAPGAFFQYSCLNFITLQRVIESISHQSLQEFTQNNIFEPIGMTHTTYKPDVTLTKHIAPTEILEGKNLLQGVVHDPLARIMMGGISGNAGLFSNADDLAIFAATMLNKGRFVDKQILSPAAVRSMTHVPHELGQFGRGLGWDLYSDYSSNKGDLFGASAYGHTGYTGTSIIIDPDSETVVILLTNRVHPNDKASVTRLRSLVANVIAAAIIK